jgi:hypothetical protein
MVVLFLLGGYKNVQGHISYTYFQVVYKQKGCLLSISFH